MRFETRRLILRPFTEEDAPDLFAYARDPRVGPAAGWPVHETVEVSRQAIRDYFSSSPYDLAIVLKETGRVIGSGGFTGCHRDWLPGKDDEIGYVLSPAYWGRGLVPEAMRELLRFGFTGLELDHVWCGHYDGNERSKRVQEKLGFLPYRSLEVEVPRLGERRLDHVSLLTRERWEALHG